MVTSKAEASRAKFFHVSRIRTSRLMSVSPSSASFRSVATIFARSRSIAQASGLWTAAKRSPVLKDSEPE